jgi:ADP-dependent NAD(P)H-hydrate dehydratase
MSVDRVTPALLRAHALPRHEQAGDKKVRGSALVIAGSVEVPGAALLAGLGVLRAGAGVLRIATCRSNAAQLGIAMPEAMILGCRETPSGGIDPSESVRLAELAADDDTVLIGPGMMDDPAVAEFTSELLRRLEGPTYTLDAAAFTTLKQHDAALPRHSGKIVLTPHSGEMAAFLKASREEIDRDPLTAAHRVADTLDAVVAMKGASTYVVSPDGAACLSENGTVGLGTSGSGDSLAGIIAGLLARGAPPYWATVWAVYMHGEAGRRLAEQYGTFGLLAREIPGKIPSIMNDLSTQSSLRNERGKQENGEKGTHHEVKGSR